MRRSLQACAPSLQTENCGYNLGVESYYARGEIQLPAQYVAGQEVTIRVHGGMKTAVADQSCTVDLTVYKSDEDGTSTGDLVATTSVAQSINDTVFGDKDFTITPTTLSPGDVLDVLITVAVDDNATAITKACIGSVQLICQTR